MTRAQRQSRWVAKRKLKRIEIRLILRRRKQKVRKSKSSEVPTRPLQQNALSMKSPIGHSEVGVTVASKHEPQDNSTGA